MNKFISFCLTFFGIIVLLNAFLLQPQTSIHQIYTMANYIFGMLILILARQFSK